MRIAVVALLALIVIFQILEFTSACKCGCGCGCGGCGCGCGGCGCGCCGGYGGYGGWGYGGINHHTVIHDRAPAVQQSCAPSVVGIPVLGSLGTKGCGCRGPCSCWD
ncbi:chorion class high-cysteine HCB protein 12-like [Thrips palmi]|uniref:Chorion class high-cysteine HCB protein 12-like n=1 Tax=Thrips palmi TaxID=161013 RepID=A0A6P8YXJ4_THRPL|nr:chorion class high-cysteine HCB protein 12-like [Thrips palmi]